MLPTASVLIMGLLAIILSPYHMERESAFLDPWEKQDGAQPLVQALTRIGDPKQ